MTRKKYICSECGNIFNEELGLLIENNIQVFCEKCGAPFTLESSELLQKEFKPIKEPSERKRVSKKEKEKKAKKERERKEIDHSKLNGTIKVFNKFAYIPILIFGIVSLILISECFANPEQFTILFIRHFTAGIAALSIAIYDNRFISKKIKEGKHNDVVLDAFCMGILGCITFGLGVLILIKGVLIIIYVFLNENNEERSFYKKGLSMKNSFCNFSSKAGYIIIVLVFNGFYSGRIKVNEIPVLTYIKNLPHISIAFPYFIAFCIFFSMALISLIINSLITHKIYYRQKFDTKHGISLIILGILAVMFYGAGIFMLLEGALLIMLRIITPEEYEEKPIIVKEREEVSKLKIEEKEPQIELPPIPFTERTEEKEKLEEGKEEFREKKIIEKPVSQPPFTAQIEKQDISEEIKEEIIKIKDEEIEGISEEKKEEELELKLHESLLPVKNKKDKKLVKEYFSKIFTLLSKEIREKIKDLDISKNERKEILKELAFLSKEQQIKYINALIYLYKEEIPQQLIDRIKNLKNVKPEHFEKLVDQLKYMDTQEQEQFIQFLEKFA